MTPAERERLFVDLFTENRDKVLRLCRSYLSDSDEVEDLFQEIMANVWKNLPRFRQEAKPTTWMYRIAVNTALLHRSRRQRAAALLQQPAGTGLPEVQSARGDDDRETQLALLHRAIQSLPPQDRLIVGLLLEDVSYKRIAEITGLTVNHVGVRISRLKRALESRLKDADDGL